MDPYHHPVPTSVPMYPSSLSSNEHVPISVQTLNSVHSIQHLGVPNDQGMDDPNRQKRKLDDYEGNDNENDPKDPNNIEGTPRSSKRRSSSKGKKSRSPTKHFTKEEDDEILHLSSLYGQDWGQILKISRLLQNSGRTADSIAHHVRYLLNKGKDKIDLKDKQKKDKSPGGSGLPSMIDNLESSTQEIQDFLNAEPGMMIDSSLNSQNGLASPNGLHQLPPKQKVKKTDDLLSVNSGGKVIDEVRRLKETVSKLKKEMKQERKDRKSERDDSKKIQLTYEETCRNLLKQNEDSQKRLEQMAEMQSQTFSLYKDIADKLK